MAVELLKRWNGTEWVLVSQVNRIEVGLYQMVTVERETISAFFANVIYEEVIQNV